MIIQQGPIPYYNFVLYRNRLHFIKEYTKTTKSTVLKTYHAVDVWV